MTRPVQPASFLRQPLDLILSSTGNVRVLRVLVGHGGALSVSRIAALTRMTTEGVRRVLGELERARVVRVLGERSARLFEACAEHPLVIGLDDLFRVEESRFHDIRKSVSAHACDGRIVAVWLFGSAARGSDGIDSDLDLVALIDAPAAEVDAIADVLRDALRDDERRLGFTASIIAVSVADLRGHITEQTALLADLRRDAVVLKGLPPDRMISHMLHARAMATS